MFQTLEAIPPEALYSEFLAISSSCFSFFPEVSTPSLTCRVQITAPPMKSSTSLIPKAPLLLLLAWALSLLFLVLFTSKLPPSSFEHLSALHTGDFPFSPSHSLWTPLI